MNGEIVRQVPAQYRDHLINGWYTFYALYTNEEGEVLVMWCGTFRSRNPYIPRSVGRHHYLLAVFIIKKK